MKVFINPGHAPKGNPDPGACGPTGLRESDVAAAVGQKVAAYLVAAGCDVKTLQHDDLAAITGTSNEWGADLFVSIHCNSCDNETAEGAETFSDYNSDAGAKLAKYIQEQIVGLPGVVDRGCKTAGFYVVKYTDAPAVLVETEFISNPSREKEMATAAWQDRIAAAIARGVTDYITKADA